MPQNPFKLQVYQEAFELSKKICKEIKDSKDFWRLKEQLAASCTSVWANLAEMGAYDNKNEQKQKIRLCIAECNETEARLQFASDMEMIDSTRCKEYINGIKVVRMKLFNLLKVIG
jgi:four helix bundle protein